MNEINIYTASAEELNSAMDMVYAEMENPYRYIPTDEELNGMADYFCRRLKAREISLFSFAFGDFNTLNR